MDFIVEEYAQQASAISTLRAILDGYPLSAGIFRELLQNSDDAGASKQIFVLDEQNHATEGLFSEGLASTQGPAFMAFNDALLRTRDWQALSAIHDSSKVVDESKIGRYGVGFRSVFNLTDSPQILSGEYLAIFDPLRLHLDSEGKKLPLGPISSSFPNQLLPFSFFMNDGGASPFRGTVIRCPLRNAPSGISDQIVQGAAITNLFNEFMDLELDISCLFLNNVKCIEIYEIKSTGVSNLLAKMTITRSVPFRSIMFTATIDINKGQITQQQEWKIIQKTFPRDEVVDLLSQQPGYNAVTVTRVIQSAKFSPEINIAIDMTGDVRGRLFSFLPLPIATGFPVHIHALFAIDTSRAHLRRSSVGLISGSQDHTKVQWNRMLFQTFIPRTWSCLLKELVSTGLVTDIFSYWPPEKSSGELEKFYAPLCETLVDALLAGKAAVWPIYELHNHSPRFRSLETLIVASATDKESVLQALARIGLSLTRPPMYIFELLRKASANPSILSPEVAHGLLLEKKSEIRQADEMDQVLLLEYLLSTQDLLNICDLPLVPVANGTKVTLSDAPGVPTYTMLTRSEFDIFGPCDDSAVPLHRLPSRVADTLVNLGPNIVNVQSLTVPRIVEYLSTYPDGLGSSRAVRWLSSFWVWMDSYEKRDELFPRIRNLSLLPSTNGLQRAESALFKLRGEHPTYTMGYLALGVPFLSRDVSDSAHHVLEHYGLAKSIRDISALLDSVPLTHPVQLSEHECEGILKHLASRQDEPLGQEEIQRLRSLPIFPVLLHTVTGNSSSVVTNWIAIPHGHAIRSVGRPRFVPWINGISFVGFDNIAPSVVKFLEPSHPNPMSENDLIELAVENLTSQPEHLQLGLLLHINSNRARIIQDIINKLRSQAFVVAEDGERHIPGDIVDPDSDVGRLYVGCPAHLPARSKPLCVEILSCLKSLRLLRSLNPEIMAERLEFISSQNTTDEALLIGRHLLSLLGSSNMDFSQVQGIAEKKWLPTNRGLCSADECRHAAFSPPDLFDEVLATLEPFSIPPSLKTALHWDIPLPLDVLIKQLDSILDSEHKYDATIEILKEFGRREWDEKDLGSLKETIRDRQWIPTTYDRLADVRSSVFNLPPTMVNSGFYQIRTDLRAEDLLRRMGCDDHPSTRAIIDKLHSLSRDSNNVDLVTVVNTSISLLRSLPDEIRTMDLERAELLIPDEDSQLRPFSEIFYNDIGENRRLVNNDGHFIGHDLLDESLVKKLGLNRLGLKYVDLQNVGPNMGQAPLTTVRHTLQQYTNQQFMFEFLANAEDAKATKFSVAINHSTTHEDKKLCVLSSAMEYLCKLPTLVVYNNAQFTPKDFEGICHTSVGGKVGRLDAIGEFGQGVLTMYHFTDLAMIISGSSVLFLDPSKRHLPLEDRASLNLTLEHVHRCYKDHLVAIDGLFDFNMSLHSYDGTLFVLPLRVTTQLSHEFIIPDFWSPERIISQILEPFKTSASDCLLFTGIQTISCVTRADGGVPIPHWSFQVQKRQGMELETYVVTEIEILDSTDSMSRWKTVKTYCTEDQLPLEFQKDILVRKPSFAGLAVRMDKSSDSHFFSILPLSAPTTIPMHVMASFKLSPDRRQIRLDGYEELQTKYNTWLLKEVIPSLYLFFLEHLHDHDDNYRLRWPSKKHDTISNLIIDSFYSPKHLTSSPRKLFSGMYSPYLKLSPQDAILYVEEPRVLRQIITLLRPSKVVDLPSGPRELAEDAKLPKVDLSFVKKEILANPGAITTSDFQTIVDIIHYLVRSPDASNILRGLPILPLENGSFGNLDNRGTGKHYYVWKPRKQQARHNFDENCFVHPKMKTDLLEKLKLNIFNLSASTIKTLIEAKLSTFDQLDISQTQLRWVDSFWDSWEEYVSLGLKADDIAPFSLISTIPPSSLTSLERCKNGQAILVEGNSQALRNCLRLLRLLVVHIDGCPDALRTVLADHAAFPRLNLKIVLSAMTRTEVPLQSLFDSLPDEEKNVFADWARKNISDISTESQITAARSLPIWESAGGGIPLALRPASEVQLLPESVRLKDVASFMAGCVADDAGLKHLNPNRITLDELPDKLLLPEAVDMETLSRYKQFYRSARCPSLPVPTGALTFKKPRDLFKREPLFTSVFPDDSPFFVHPLFEGFEEQLIESHLRSEKDLNMGIFKDCAQRLSANNPTAAKEVFRAFSEILPNHVTNQQRTWQELDAIHFIPRRMDTVRKLPSQDENDAGLEIPPEVMHLDAIVQPVEIVREDFEAIAWSQRACFEIHPRPNVFQEYPDLGRPGFSEVIAHLRYLSNLRNLSTSQHRILLHDVEKIYQHFENDFDHHMADEVFVQAIHSLRDQPLFLNIDGEEDKLNWVQGRSLAIGCLYSQGSIQGVRTFLLPFKKILLFAGAIKVVHPCYKPEYDTRLSDSVHLKEIRTGFDELRKEKTLTDVVFIVDPTEDVPHPEPLFAHRSLLAVSSEHFKNLFCRRDASPSCPLTIKVSYSWQSLRSLLDFIYTRSKGADIFSLELLLEILAISNTYKVVDLFDEVQREILDRKLLTPDSMNKIKAAAIEQQAKELLKACDEYEFENTDFIRKSRIITQICDM